MPLLALEYRKIGLLPTCLGNERLRITDAGCVDHSLNTCECEPGHLWSDDWRPVGLLDTASIAELAEQISASGLLTLPRESIAPSVEGGKREELDLTLGDTTYCFVVQNTDSPVFRRVVRWLHGAKATAESATQAG